MRITIVVVLALLLGACAGSKKPLARMIQTRNDQEHPTIEQIKHRTASMSPEQVRDTYLGMLLDEPGMEAYYRTALIAIGIAGDKYTPIILQSRGEQPGYKFREVAIEAYGYWAARNYGEEEFRVANVLAGIILKPNEADGSRDLQIQLACIKALAEFPAGRVKLRKISRNKSLSTTVRQQAYSQTFPTHPSGR